MFHAWSPGKLALLGNRFGCLPMRGDGDGENSYSHEFSYWSLLFHRVETA